MNKKWCLTLVAGQLNPRVALASKCLNKWGPLDGAAHFTPRWDLAKINLNSPLLILFSFKHNNNPKSALYTQTRFDIPLQKKNPNGKSTWNIGQTPPSPSFPCWASFKIPASMAGNHEMSSLSLSTKALHCFCIDIKRRGLNRWREGGIQLARNRDVAQ
jgi:hypothetical protein